MALMMREEYGNFSIVQREPLIIFIFAVVAQLVEHFHGNKRVFPEFQKVLDITGYNGYCIVIETTSHGKQVAGKHLFFQQKTFYAVVAQLVEHVHGYHK